MQCQEDSLIQAGSVQVPRNWFSCPTVQLQLFRVGGVGVRLGQDVAIAVLVEGVLQGVPVRGQALSCEQRVTGTHKHHAGISRGWHLSPQDTPLQSCPCAQGLRSHPLQIIDSL